MPTATLSSRTTQQSQQAFQTAQQLMPGGVNSPVRAFKNVGGSPLFFEKASGPYVWDIDGNQYIDYVSSWGPAIVGHAHPKVIERVQAVASHGLSFGAPTRLENELAELVIQLVPSIEKVRFVSSGTEAAMSALRLARAATGRNKIIKFEGCYHGHADFLLVKAGSGALTHGTPDSAGVSEDVAKGTLTATFNDLASVEALLKQYPNEVAAIAVEPVAGNMGCILPQPGFLEGLRTLATQYGALLVFDEVMTGFRVALGGAQTRYSVMPDITVLGKIVGGGLPAAAYGASKDLMKWVSPEGPMYQAGTLSGNPLAMAAGLETLQILQAPHVYDELETRTLQLVNGLQQIATAKGIPVYTTQVGAMFSLFFTAGPVHNFNDVMQVDRECFKQFFFGMLDAGVYLAPSPYEAGFTSLAHSEDIIQTTLQAAERVMQTLG